MYIEVKLLTKVTITATQIFEPIFDTISLAKSLYSNPDARFYMSVTGVSGTTPTLDLNIKGVMGVGDEEGGSLDFAIGSFTQVTANSRTNHVVNNCPRFTQIQAVVGGTSPSFTIELWVAR